MYRDQYLYGTAYVSGGNSRVAAKKYIIHTVPEWANEHLTKITSYPEWSEYQIDIPDGETIKTLTGEAFNEIILKVLKIHPGTDFMKLRLYKKR
jgi:hypothetical protein